MHVCLYEIYMHTYKHQVLKNMKDHQALFSLSLSLSLSLQESTAWHPRDSDLSLSLSFSFSLSLSLAICFREYASIREHTQISHFFFVFGSLFFGCFGTGDRRSCFGYRQRSTNRMYYRVERSKKSWESKKKNFVVAYHRTHWRVRLPNLLGSAKTWRRCDITFP